MSSMPVASIPDLPPALLPLPAREFFRTMNVKDVQGLVQLFSDDAVVNDQMQEHAGANQIGSWAASEIFGLDMTAEVLGFRPRPAGAIVSATVKGNFDAPGLPEPLVLSFYFVSNGEKIDQLIILRDGL